MTTRKRGGKQSRQRYPEEFKAQAVQLAESVGTTAAARELGIQTSQIYNWRTKIRHAETTSEAENRLLAENARLKRELIEQRDELALLKNPPRPLRLPSEGGETFGAYSFVPRARAVRFLVALTP